MEFYISLETIEFFITIVVAGVCYGFYCYRNGLRRGWDNAMYTLEEEGIISIDDTGEVARVDDKKYKECRDYR